MRISFPLIASLVVVVSLVVFLSVFFQVRQEKGRLNDELERRAGILAESMQETVEPLLAKGSSKNLQRIVERFGNRERLSGVAVYDAAGRPLAVTESLSSLLQSPPKLAAEALDRDAGMGHLERVGNAVFSSTEETTPLV